MFRWSQLCAAVVGDVEAAVAADEHVPAVLRVDPQGVLVGVDVRRPRPAANVLPPSVLRAAGRDRRARRRCLSSLGSTRIWREVDRPRVEAVDARPRLAAVRATCRRRRSGSRPCPGLLLHVLALPADVRSMRNGRSGSAAPRRRAAGEARSRRRQRQRRRRALLLAASLKVTFTLSPALRGFVGLRRDPQFGAELAQVLDLLAVDARRRHADLHAGLLGRRRPSAPPRP